MSRIGVFLCWCGENIARTVDVEAATERIAVLPGVQLATHYTYMCSDPGQARVRAAIAEQGLDGVVIASCSPHMHLRTFRRAAAAAGLNPYLVEMANIREQCSWVHHDRATATDKAVDIVRMAVQKVAADRELHPVRVPVTKRALVIGGGVAGIQAALDIADAGHEVVLVERAPSIGGTMAGLSETFPTLDCSQCILTPRMVEVGQHPRITLYTHAEVEKVDGFVGNFTATIRRKARYIDTDACTGCGDCWNRCPVKKVPSEFDHGTGNRTAVYVPFPQAVPARPVIDPETCIYLKDVAAGRPKPRCGACAKKCAAEAVRLDDVDRTVTEQIGAVVVATGFDLYSIGPDQPDPRLQGYPEYGHGRYPDVIDSLQFERLVSASGPTGGELRRPSDGKIPRRVVFVSCVGSRDDAKGISYCSKVCCMYSAKHTMLYRHKVPDGEAHVFYMDIRAAGKGYDEFVRRAVEQDGARYHRGRVAEIVQDGDHLVVSGADTLLGRRLTLEADLVVLATAIRPAAGSDRIARGLNVGLDQDGFMSEAHPKLRPVETTAAGVFLAGACQGPKDIPESVAQASAVAGKVAVLFAGDELTREPEIAHVDPNRCSGCLACVRTCPFTAIGTADVLDREGHVIRTTARVNEGLCMGCGTCVAVCPSKSVDLDGFSEEQMYAQLEGISL
ncbi:MAG: heterodisulfide reductase subunit [Actinomycetota bacterium]|nr:heterodisulfide reductase subunit [Actinomycetota bacterium]